MDNIGKLYTTEAENICQEHLNRQLFKMQCYCKHEITFPDKGDLKTNIVTSMMMSVPMFIHYHQP